MIQAENLSKIFKQGRTSVHAVEGVSLLIEKGERVYVHGPSGAGKSTLLHMLGALSVPTSGSLKFDGKDVYALSDAKRSRIRNRNFGFIFQFYHLLPELNVMENVMLPAMIRGGRSKRVIRDASRELLDSVGMLDRLKHRPNQLSGGEMQRVAIARALVNSPEALFCDEPTGNLDSEMAREIYLVLLEVSRDKNMSVIVVSHQGVGKDFFHTEYFMKDGFLERQAENELKLTKG